MRKALLPIAIACAAAQGVQAETAETPERVVPCSEIILEARFPYRGAYRERDRYRTIFNSVSVPPAYLIRSYPTGETPWRYFSKSGMVVKQGTTVTITVPPGWRRHLAIAWGNAQHRAFHTIRIAPCRFSGRPGAAYAGGFYLRTPRACVPLTFIVRHRRKTMWFGIGTKCR